MTKLRSKWTTSRPRTEEADLNKRWLVALSLFYFFQLSSAFAGTYLPRYMGILGMSGTAIGLAFGAQAVARSIAMPLWSYASDRFGMSARLVKIQFVLALPYLFLPFVTDPDVLVILLVLVGPTIGCAIPITDVVTMRELSPSAFGRIRALGSLGFGLCAAAFAALGVVYSHTELARGSVWVVVGLLALGGVSAAAFPRSEATVNQARFHDVLAMLRNPWLLVLMPLWCVHWASQVPYNMYLVYFAEARGFGAWVPGAAVFAGITAEVAFLAMGTSVVERLGPLRSFAVVVAVTAARWAFMAMSVDPWIVIGLQFAHGLTFGGFMLSMMSVLNREVAPGVRSTARCSLQPLSLDWAAIG
ncbi:MAG: MFS transporter [bacterium]